MASPAAEEYGGAAVDRSAKKNTDRTLIFVGIGAVVCAILVALSQGKLPFFTGIGSES